MKATPHSSAKIHPVASYQAQAMYGQCGGRDWKGYTQCEAGLINLGFAKKKPIFVILAGWCGVQRQGPDVGTLAYRRSNKWISLNASDLFFWSCEFNLTFHPRNFFLKEYFHLWIHWGALICMQKFVFPRVPPSQVVDQDFSQCVPATAVGIPNCDYVTCVDPYVLYFFFVSMFLEL